jgi:dihydropyrimidinase
LYSEGVKKGKITVNKFVEVLSTNPAKIFGMHPKKGCIAP